MLSNLLNDCPSDVSPVICVAEAYHVSAILLIFMVVCSSPRFVFGEDSLILGDQTWVISVCSKLFFVDQKGC